ncbi:MAG: adenylyltransferase/cytidyltransferase family protein, partial [Thermodesulfovibrionales bacterium]
MKIGVFGGTFNPIHYGHLRAAEEAREALALDKVLFIPAGNPPLKSSNIADAEKRYEMAKIATAGNR